LDFLNFGKGFKTIRFQKTSKNAIWKIFLSFIFAKDGTFGTTKAKELVDFKYLRSKIILILKLRLRDKIDGAWE